MPGRSSFRRTTSKVLSAIFNILGPLVEGSRFLDLYAGVGTVGIEALLRGATEVVFVEADRRRASEIKTNLTRKGLSSRALVLQSRVENFLKNYSDQGFDIVFLDPPYHEFRPEEILQGVSEKLLKEATRVVLEHFHKLEVPSEVGRLVLQKQYRYGDTVLSLFKTIEL